MLVAGRVDYAADVLELGVENIASLGLSGKIEPLLSREHDGRKRLCQLHQGARFARIRHRVLPRLKAIQTDQRV